MSRTSLLPKQSDYGFKIDLNSSRRLDTDMKNALLELEEEDDFLKEDPNDWDVFKDAHKFEKRDRIIEKRKKARVDEELKELRSHREMNVEN